MSNIKRLLDELKGQLAELKELSNLQHIQATTYLNQVAFMTHKTMHVGKENWPNSSCVFCAKEIAEIQDDHIQGEVNEQVMAEREVEE